MPARSASIAALCIGCVDPTTAPTPPGPDVEALQATAIAPVVAGGSWQPLARQPSFAASIALQAPDGSVLVQEVSSSRWWRLSPDVTGDYVHGTWSSIASTASTYAPLYFASGFLPDGRLVVMGGEYNLGNDAWTKLGAIYDPHHDVWTALAAPQDWTSIGDASSILLSDGTFMLSDCCSTRTALLDASTLTWRATGVGKADKHDEESWVLLRDGTVLTVDCNNNNRASEIYDPATGRWSYAGDTPVQLMDPGSHEIGPEILLGDGRVLVIGATGHNALYDPATKEWMAGPDFPNLGTATLDSADGPGVLLPSGNALVAASPGVYNPPIHMFEFDGIGLTEVPAPASAAGDSTFNDVMLILPTGQILLTNQSSDIEVYTPTAPANAAWAPVILSIPTLVSASGAHAMALEPLTTLYAGQTYEVWARRPNGVSQGTFYGDDVQNMTGFPLVKLTSTATGHVTYARTHDGSTYAVGPEVTGTTRFDIPTSIEPGPATMTMIANGIPSPAVTVEIK